MFQEFSSLTHTHKTLCILIHHFHFLHFYPFIYIYIYIYISTHRQKTMLFTFNLLMMYHLSLHFNSPFSLLALLPPLYTHTHTHKALRAIPYQIHIDQKQCHLLSMFRRHLPNSDIVVSSNPDWYELAIVKEGELEFYIE